MLLSSPSLILSWPPTRPPTSPQLASLRQPSHERHKPFHLFLAVLCSNGIINWSVALPPLNLEGIERSMQNRTGPDDCGGNRARDVPPQTLQRLPCPFGKLISVPSALLARDKLCATCND